MNYGLSNVIVIDAPDGFVLIDTLDSATALTPILDDVQQINPNKKIKAILYTHHHPDHVGGAIVSISNISGTPYKTIDGLNVGNPSKEMHIKLLQYFSEINEYFRVRVVLMVTVPFCIHILAGVIYKTPSTEKYCNNLMCISFDYNVQWHK